MNNSEDDVDTEKEKILCVYCGKEIKSQGEAWPHVDGNSNLGVKKIDYFCSNEHKSAFFSS